MVEYAALTASARRSGAKIFFADEAHFRADADLRGKWVLKGEPALVDSTSPRRGEKVSYYSAVCLETGEVEVMELEGNSNSATSAAFLRQLRARHAEPLTVIWDNSPAHRGDAIRAYLTTPGLNLHLVNLPSYSPDFNADEAIWGWARQGATANRCLGTKAAVQEQVGDFFTRLSSRREAVKRRCRTMLQAQADELIGSAQADFSAHQCRSHLVFGLGEQVAARFAVTLRRHPRSSATTVARRVCWVPSLASRTGRAGDPLQGLHELQGFQRDFFSDPFWV